MKIILLDILQIESESELYALCADVYPTFMYPSLSGEEVELIPGGRNISVRYLEYQSCLLLKVRWECGMGRGVYILFSVQTL